jgi:hypothetical protein
LDVGCKISNIQAKGTERKRSLIYSKALEVLRSTALKSNKVVSQLFRNVVFNLGQNMQTLEFSKPLTLSATQIHRAR